MGVATILIILCHMPAHRVVMPDIISSLIVYGGLGCDIFLFLSGMGMWYSIRKAGLLQRGVILWLNHRYCRILVPYLLFCIPCFAIYALRDDWSFSTYLWRLSTLSFWSDHWGLWFIALILVLYLVTPLLNLLMRGRYKWAIIILLVLLSWTYGSSVGSSGFEKNAQFALCRVPSYLLGFTLAENIRSEKEVSLLYAYSTLLILFVICVIIRLFTNISVSMFWIEGMILMITLTIVLHALSNNNRMLSFFRFLGSISLESYCTNVFLLPLFMYLPYHICDINFNPGNWTYYILGTFFCLIISVYVNRISRQLLK